MSVTLAFAFELGLALSLAAILLSDKNKKQTLPWILMVVLCLVQVVGNVYSTFKYISLSETEYYQYLAKPLLFFIEEVSQDTVQIIVSWIIGAILPIIALFMTDMVASNIKNLHSDDNEDKEIEETNIDNSDYKKELDPEVKKVEIKQPIENNPKEIVPPKTENKEITPKEVKPKEIVPPKTEKPHKSEEHQEPENYKTQKGYYEYPYKDKENH